MAKDPNEIYSAEWFARDFKDLRPEFFLAADALYREFLPRSQVIDVGCGPGMMLERFDMLGVRRVHGIEGSIHGIEMASDRIRDRITHNDITKLPADLLRCLRDYEGGPHCLVVCTEVAEHLEAQHADHLVELLTGAHTPIVFTAAPPGQGGHDHVNERQPLYWIDKFEARGAIYDVPRTDRLSKRWSGLNRLSHMARNVMVFT